jgi:hypothetical protein
LAAIITLVKILQYFLKYGNKLPPYIILNRTTVAKENFCKAVIVQAQENVWLTSELMEDWLG